MRGWKSAFAFKLRKPFSSEATTRSYTPHCTASSAASASASASASAAANRAASFSAAASRAATSAYAVFCPSAPVAPVEDSPSAASAASSAFPASSANSAGATQSAPSTSPAVSACSSLNRSAFYFSSCAPSFSARFSHADLRASPTPAATCAASSALAPPTSVADPLADCRATFSSSSWRRSMSIAIPACDGDDEVHAVGEDEGGEAEEEAGEMAESDGRSGGAQDSAVDIDSLSRMVPELSWGQLSELAAGKEKMDWPVVSGGVVKGGAVEGGAVQECAVEWCAMEEDAWDEPESPAMVPACSLCGPAQRDKDERSADFQLCLNAPRGGGRVRLDRMGSGGGDGSGGGGTATVVWYVPRFGRHRQQRSIVREVAREAVRDIARGGAR
ncbi:unnamed protein product [Closterium sp. NIES-65]|nr:unnamed protein product [Closterium sp. NIES-65]